MKILIVCNNAYYRGNGMCTAIQTLYRELNEAGVEARIMSCANPDTDGLQPEYPLGHFKFPFFEKIIYSNGFRYAAALLRFTKPQIIRLVAVVSFPPKSVLSYS